MELFQRHGYNPRRDLGQNFLIDVNLVEFIARSAEITARDVVLEVGAGTGGMTAFLVQNAGHVVSVELDENVFPLAQEAVQDAENVTLLKTDILKNKNTLSPQVLEVVQEKLDSIPDSRLKLVSNLPYNVATPVVSNLVATDLPWKRMVITIQLELGQRMSAKPGSSHYGALSAWLQSQCFVKILKQMGPQVFWPRPKVNSAIVLLRPQHERRNAIGDRQFFHDFVRRLFHHRRKLMRGVLRGMYRKQIDKAAIDHVLAELKFPESARAEQQPVDRLVALSKRIQKLVETGELIDGLNTPES
ncbi:MAG: 16S rRNA (adenine(1518)-N(6)/adenine(1519)-N(6))-dimethyltransferase RsmA [Planctomycetaceae bacterium]